MSQIIQLQCSLGHKQCFRTVWNVPKNIPYFEGHFPDHPILPAFVTIDKTSDLIMEALKDLSRPLMGVKSAKFMSPITPEMELEIDLHHLGEQDWQAEWKNIALPHPSNLVALVTLFLGL